MFAVSPDGRWIVGIHRSPTICEAGRCPLLISRTARGGRARRASARAAAPGFWRIEAAVGGLRRSTGGAGRIVENWPTQRDQYCPTLEGRLSPTAPGLPWCVTARTSIERRPAPGARWPGSTGPLEPGDLHECHCGWIVPDRAAPGPSCRDLVSPKARGGNARPWYGSATASRGHASALAPRPRKSF